VDKPLSPLRYNRSRVDAMDSAATGGGGAGAHGAGPCCALRGGGTQHNGTASGGARFSEEATRGGCALPGESALSRKQQSITPGRFANREHGTVGTERRCGWMCVGGGGAGDGAL
jgi:hypothetical protein